MMYENMLGMVMLFLIQLAVAFGIFVFLTAAVKFLYNKIEANSFVQSHSRLLNLDKYLPIEEVTTIRQVFYLVMIVIFVVNIIYIIFRIREGAYNIFILDILVSLYLAVNEDIDFSKKKWLYFLLIPFGSLSYISFPINNYAVILYWVHIFAFVYFIRVYYYKFVEYTETNSLGITIMLLFLIVFASFLITMLVEGKYPMDALVMVSNAFTSNGYSVLGQTTLGKLNAIVLVWSGFILSGVGTATLAAAIITKTTDKKFDELEEKIKKARKK